MWQKATPEQKKRQQKIILILMALSLVGTVVVVEIYKYGMAAVIIGLLIFAVCGLIWSETFGKPSTEAGKWLQRHIANNERDREVSRQIELLTAVPRLEADRDIQIKTIDDDLAKLQSFGNWQQQLMEGLSLAQREFFTNQQQLLGSQLNMFAQMFGMKLDYSDRDKARAHEIDKVYIQAMMIPDASQRYADLGTIVSTVRDLHAQVDKIKDSRRREQVRRWLDEEMKNR